MVNLLNEQQTGQREKTSKQSDKQTDGPMGQNEQKEGILPDQPTRASRSWRLTLNPNTSNHTL